MSAEPEAPLEVVTAGAAPAPHWRVILHALRHLPRDAIAAEGLTGFRIAAALIMLVFLAIAWLWPLGGSHRLFPPAFDADRTVQLPAPEPITQAERDYLTRTYPAFAQGFAANVVRPWDYVLVGKGMFRVKPASKPLLDQAFAGLRDVAAASRANDHSRAGDLSRINGLLDRVENIEGKDRAVVLYHRGLARYLSGGKGDRDSARVLLDKALKITTDQSPASPDELTAKRITGVKIALQQARGEVLLAQGKFDDAQKALAAARDLALGARVFPNEGKRLFRLGPARQEPNPYLVTIDTGPLWNDDLVAARRAGDRKTVAAILDDLAAEPTAVRREDRLLSTNLQIAAAFEGDPRVAEFQPDLTETDPADWRTASYAARFISGAAPLAGQSAGPPLTILKPWNNIKAWREALRESYTGKTLSKLFAGDQEDPADAAPLPAWRTEVMDDIGRKLIARGLDGSRPLAYRFILANQDQFSGSVVGDAAIRTGFMDAPVFVAWIVAGLVLALGLMCVWGLAVLRRSYQLTFTPYHWNDRIAGEDQPAG